MRIGMKFYTRNPFKDAEKFVKATDFIEIMPVPGYDYRPFKRLGQPVVIHAAHVWFGFNPANPEKEERTREILKLALEAADYLDAEKIIFHIGKMENDKCSAERALKFFLELKDKRMIVENLPIGDFKRAIGDGDVTIETNHDSVEKQMNDIAFLRK